MAVSQNRTLSAMQMHPGEGVFHVPFMITVFFVKNSSTPCFILFIYFFAMLWGMWDLSSLIED